MKNKALHINPNEIALQRDKTHFEIQLKYKRSYYDKKYNRAKAKKERW